MIIAYFLFGLGLLALVYAFSIGIYWFRPKYPINKDGEVKRAEMDDRLHNDIQSLIQEMRQGRNEKNHSM